MLPLHDSKNVRSFKHAISWCAFAAAAGAVNSGAFVSTEKFVSHLTGALTTVGLETLAIDGMVLIGAFVLGAMASVSMLQYRVLKGKTPLYSTPLLIVMAIIAFVGVAGHLGVFGEMGGGSEDNDWRDVTMLALLSFSMGLLNASVSTTTAHAIRTTHVTGPSTDLGVHLATALVTDGVARQEALSLALLRGGTILAFGFGAAAMPFPMLRIGFLAYLIPAGLVLFGTWRSFWVEAKAAAAATVRSPQTST